MTEVIARVAALLDDMSSTVKDEALIETLAERSPEDVGAMLAMATLGTRLCQVFLSAASQHGWRAQRTDTNLDRNAADLDVARELLRELSVECSNRPRLIPANVGELLARVANALAEARENRSPSLFDLPDPQRPGGGRRPAECEGRVAAALDILIATGTELAEAERLLDAEMRKAGLVDAAGNSIGAKRVNEWRRNFRKRSGAADARKWFEFELGLEHPRALRGAPPNAAKVQAGRDYARRLIRLLSKIANRTVPVPKASRS